MLVYASFALSSYPTCTHSDTNMSSASSKSATSPRRPHRLPAHWLTVRLRPRSPVAPHTLVGCSLTYSVHQITYSWRGERSGSPPQLSHPQAFVSRSWRPNRLSVITGTVRTRSVLDVVDHHDPSIAIRGGPNRKSPIRTFRVERPKAVRYTRVGSATRRSLCHRASRRYSALYRRIEPIERPHSGRPELLHPVVTPRHRSVRRPRRERRPRSRPSASRTPRPRCSPACRATRRDAPSRPGSRVGGIRSATCAKFTKLNMRNGSDSESGHPHPQTDGRTQHPKPMNTSYT